MAESETNTSAQSSEIDKKVDKRPKINQEPDTPGKIMVSGIPKNENYTDADLEKEFAPFGRITEVNIIRDRRSNLPRGFGFITYENPQDAEDAIKALEGKNLGGETPIHCEQAVIGLRRSKQLTDEVRGGGRGRGGRGADRGRGRGVERGGRGKGNMERSGRGRGIMERGGRGMRGRPQPDRYADMGAGPLDDYYEEFYEPELAYDSYPRGGPGSRRGPAQRGGLLGREGPPERGGLIRGRDAQMDAPPGRGIVPGRSRGSAGMEPLRGGPPKRALLPHPSARGSRGGYGGPFRRDEYYDDNANGYQEEYYETQRNDPYGEVYEEQYPESEDYFTRGRPEPLMGRASIPSRGRGRFQPVDEYGYSYEEEDAQSRLQAPVQRRNMAAGYLEEEYEENIPQLGADPYDRPRIRAPAPVPLVRVARGGAVPSRRGGLLGNVPYSVDESAMYDSVSGPTAGPTPGYEVESYGDSFGRRPAAPAANRMRPTPLADVYITEKIKPKPQPLMAEMVGQRRGLMGATGHYLDNYQSTNAAPAQGRDAFAEARRPPVRRDPYQRVAAETDDYVSYPPTSRGSADLSRKRHIEAFEEELPRAGRREFEEYRSSPASAPMPLKRDRLDRNVYEAYSSRQEGAYRGL